MEAYLQVFVNLKQEDGARLLFMAEFAYNNVKNASTGHTSFKLNCGYHPQASYKKDVNPCSQSKLVDKLANELRELIAVCKKKLPACTRASKALSR